MRGKCSSSGIACDCVDCRGSIGCKIRSARYTGGLGGGEILIASNQVGCILGVGGGYGPGRGVNGECYCVLNGPNSNLKFYDFGQI